MKAATITELKRELAHKTPKELVELCLRLTKFKKENKELFTYLLFEASDEAAYIESTQQEMDEQFEEINTTSYYFMRKSVRKILSGVKRHIRYSKKKETEVALLLYFCKKLKMMRPSIQRNTVLTNTYERQIAMVEKAMATLHEDLQYDFGLMLDEIKDY